MIALVLLAWLLFDLLLVSLVEYAVHRWLMHGRVLDAFWFPHMLHHGRYYRRFDHETDPAGRELNLRIGWLDTGLALLLASPLTLLSVRGYLILIVLSVLQRFAWNAVHCEMHLVAGRCFSKWRVYLLLRRWHFLHHQQPRRNFNVTLPVWDFVFGTVATPTAADREEWRKIEENAP